MISSFDERSRRSGRLRDGDVCASRAVHIVTRIVLVSLLACAVESGATLSASQFPSVIPLPGATSTEGIALGTGSTFYAGDLFTGDIFRGDLRSGAVEKFIDVPAGRMAVGLKADVSHGLLFVAGGFTGQAYIYDLDMGTDVAVLQLGAFINDVALTNDAAWFTDSVLPHLYRVSFDTGSVTTLVVTGPAADVFGFTALNGIAATPDGKTLIVSHSALGAIFTVDPETGVSAPIGGLVVPSADGILLEGGRLFVAQPFLDQILEIDLSPDLSTGTVEATITSQNFQVPTTVARFGDRLATVNAKFDTGFPPTAETYEVVLVRLSRE